MELQVKNRSIWKGARLQRPLRLNYPMSSSHRFINEATIEKRKQKTNYTKRTIDMIIFAARSSQNACFSILCGKWNEMADRTKRI